METKETATPKATTGTTATPKKKRVSKRKSRKSKSPVSAKKLDKKNVKDTVKTIVKSRREIKYKYPDGMEDILTKKAWRQKVRSKLKSFESNMTKIRNSGGKGITKIKKEYMAYRKEVLMVP